MDIRYFKATWGMDGSLEDQLRRIKAAGFHGVEAGLPENPSEFRKAAEGSGLAFAAIAFPQSPDDVKCALDSAVSSGACLLNLHSGKDWWPFGEGVRFLQHVQRIQEGAPIPVCHETHRGRLFFAPAVTAAYIAEVPGVAVAADFSHWTCVCESMLSDQEPALKTAIGHTIHIHARVGHEEGPQVSDPRAPEFRGHIEAFVSWWQRIVDSARARGQAWLGIDPEFGPPGYMQTLPYTRLPVADLWDVCVWTRDFLHGRLR